MEETSKRGIIRAWLKEHLIDDPNPPQEILAMSDVKIAEMFGAWKSAVSSERKKLGIPTARQRAGISDYLPSQPLDVGGEPMHYEAIGKHDCKYCKGLVRRPGYREPGHCLCGLVLDNGEIGRSRCNKTCKFYERFLG